ncbi:MAG: sigma-70 family RNA polymerase sigma factor [Anaerolineae bacterium]
MWRHRETERQPRFEDIALPHIDALYRTARRLTGNAQSAEDLVQDTYLRAYDAFDRFDGRYPRAWLFTIMRHTYISQLRRASHARFVDMDTDPTMEEEWHGAAADSVEDELLVGILPEELEVALAALPEAWRMALVLADVEELSYEEIAQVMECPVGTVMSRLYRARRRLEAALLEARAARKAQGQS